MEPIFKKLRVIRSVPLCLVCGVDSTPIKIFLFTVIGGLVLSSISLMVWAWSTKRLNLTEDKAMLPLEAEKEHK